jgi:DNA-binding transcriptional LysR family regulator
LIELALHDAPMEELAVWAVMPSRHHVPARVRVFLAALQAALDRQRI